MYINDTNDEYTEQQPRHQTNRQQNISFFTFLVLYISVGFLVFVFLFFVFGFDRDGKSVSIVFYIIFLPCVYPCAAENGQKSIRPKRKHPLAHNTVQYTRYSHTLQWDFWVERRA